MRSPLSSTQLITIPKQSYRYSPALLLATFISQRPISPVGVQSLESAGVLCFCPPTSALSVHWSEVFQLIVMAIVPRKKNIWGNLKSSPTRNGARNQVSHGTRLTLYSMKNIITYKHCCLHYWCQLSSSIYNIKHSANSWTWSNHLHACTVEKLCGFSSSSCWLTCVLII